MEIVPAGRYIDRQARTHIEDTYRCVLRKINRSRQFERQIVTDVITYRPTSVNINYDNEGDGGM